MHISLITIYRYSCLLAKQHNEFYVHISHRHLSIAHAIDQLSKATQSAAAFHMSFLTLWANNWQSAACAVTPQGEPIKTLVHSHSHSRSHWESHNDSHSQRHWHPLCNKLKIYLTAVDNLFAFNLPQLWKQKPELDPKPKPKPEQEPEWTSEFMKS